MLSSYIKMVYIKKWVNERRKRRRVL